MHFSGSLCTSDLGGLKVPIPHNEHEGKTLEMLVLVLTDLLLTDVLSAFLFFCSKQSLY